MVLNMEMLVVQGPPEPEITRVAEPPPPPRPPVHDWGADRSPEDNDNSGLGEQPSSPKPRPSEPADAELLHASDVIAPTPSTTIEPTPAPAPARRANARDNALTAMVEAIADKHLAIAFVGAEPSTGEPEIPGAGSAGLPQLDALAARALLSRPKRVWIGGIDSKGEGDEVAWSALGAAVDHRKRAVRPLGPLPRIQSHALQLPALQEKLAAAGLHVHASSKPTDMDSTLGLGPASELVRGVRAATRAALLPEAAVQPEQSWPDQWTMDSRWLPRPRVPQRATAVERHVAALPGVAGPEAAASAVAELFDRFAGQRSDAAVIFADGLKELLLGAGGGAACAALSRLSATAATAGIVWNGTARIEAGPESMKTADWTPAQCASRVVQSFVATAMRKSMHNVVVVGTAALDAAKCKGDVEGGWAPVTKELRREAAKHPATGGETDWQATAGPQVCPSDEEVPFRWWTRWSNMPVPAAIQRSLLVRFKEGFGLPDGEDPKGRVFATTSRLSRDFVGLYELPPEGDAALTQTPLTYFDLTRLRATGAQPDAGIAPSFLRYAQAGCSDAADPVCEARRAARSAVLVGMMKQLANEGVLGTPQVALSGDRDAAGALGRWPYVSGADGSEAPSEALAALHAATEAIAKQVPTSLKVEAPFTGVTVKDNALDHVNLCPWLGYSSEMVVAFLPHDIFIPIFQPVLAQLSERGVPVFADTDLQHMPMPHNRPVALSLLSFYSPRYTPQPGTATMDSPFVAMQYEYSDERLKRDGTIEYLSKAALVLDYSPSNIETYGDKLAAVPKADSPLLARSQRWLSPQPARMCYHRSVSVQMPSTDMSVWNPKRPIRTAEMRDNQNLRVETTAAFAATLYGSTSAMAPRRMHMLLILQALLMGKDMVAYGGGSFRNVKPEDKSDWAPALRTAISEVQAKSEADPFEVFIPFDSHYYGGSMIRHMQEYSPVTLNLHSLLGPGPGARLETARILPIAANGAALIVSELGSPEDAWIHKALGAGMTKEAYEAAQRGEDVALEDPMTAADGLVFLDPPPQQPPTEDGAPKDVVRVGIKFAVEADEIATYAAGGTHGGDELLGAGPSYGHREAGEQLVAAVRVASALHTIRQMSPEALRERVESTKRAARVHLACDRVPSGALSTELLVLAARTAADQAVESLDE